MRSEEKHDGCARSGELFDTQKRLRAEGQLHVREQEVHVESSGNGLL